MQRELPHRFLFYNANYESGHPTTTLGGEEHRHLRQVLRARVGDTVFVTNGRGVIARGTVSSITRTRSDVIVDETIRPRKANEVTAFVAALRKDAFEIAVKQGTEVGVTRFVPFVTEKSHVKRYSPSFLERLERIAVSAMKQSFRSVLPAIEPVMAFTGLVERLGDYGSVFIGDTSAEKLRGGVDGDRIAIIVGPEAGLTLDEVYRLTTAGSRPVSVSDHRLRAETAVVLLAAIVLQATD